MNQTTQKEIVAPKFSVRKTEKHNGNNNNILALRLNEHSAVIDAEAAQNSYLSELIRVRAAEKRHQSDILECA